MNSYEQYYREILYPLQDGVMSIINKLNTPFFLTGGTALSRQYSNHRFSDDLDLFVNSDASYQEWVEKIFRALFNSEVNSGITIGRSSIRRLKDFSQVFVSMKDRPEAQLKIELVNDVAEHFGDFEFHPTLGKIDSWRNILSNKVAALFRPARLRRSGGFEPKDISDMRSILRIWSLARLKNFSWKEIVREA
ncbi:MAG: nucleotidyl transferase AbiEii/AbiGii toxin family protein, partial [Bacteroidota bacterium]